VRPGERVKTDPRDARRLAGLHAGGLLEPVAVPSEPVEALRDLARAREDARLDRMRDRHRTSKFLLRHGLRMPNRSWGVTRRRWRGSVCFEHPHQQLALQTYLHALELVDRRIEHLERELDRAAAAGPWAAGRAAAVSARDRPADRARAGRRDRHRLEPLSDRRAVHELRRAGPVRALLRRAALAGIDHRGRQRSRPPAARRGRRRRRRRPRVGETLAARQRGQDPLVLEHAWRAQQRLHRRWQRMAGRGKPHQKIVVATARELAGFVWAIATNQPLRNT
jgi:transposase